MSSLIPVGQVKNYDLDRHKLLSMFHWYLALSATHLYMYCTVVANVQIIRLEIGLANLS